MTYKSISTA